MKRKLAIILLISISTYIFAQIKVGDKAPVFKLTDKNGEVFDLSTLIGKKNLVIYFYPKDETPGCTAEACTFRDNYEDFLQYNCEVIGISNDSPESHASFADNHSLPFILLTDENRKVQKLYGVPKTAGIMTGRVTYLVDKNGGVQMVFNSQSKATQHTTEALAKLKEINSTD